MAFTDDLIQNLELRPKCYITLEASQYTITAEDIRNGTVATKLAKANATFTEERHKTAVNNNTKPVLVIFCMIFKVVYVYSQH